jgi:hypothetical protein
MSATTSRGLTYPTSGDNVSPLETVFATLASDVDDEFGPAADSAVLSSNYNVQSTEADVGMSVTVTTTKANQQVQITINAYAACNTASSTHLLAILCNVDGSNLATHLYWLTGSTSENNVRRTLSRSWLTTLATAGSHTIKVRASCTTNNDFTINATDSDLQVIVA